MTEKKYLSWHICSINSDTLFCFVFSTAVFNRYFLLIISRHNTKRKKRIIKYISWFQVWEYYYSARSSSSSFHICIDIGSSSGSFIICIIIWKKYIVLCISCLHTVLWLSCSFAYLTIFHNTSTINYNTGYPENLIFASFVQSIQWLPIMLCFINDSHLY